MAKKIVKPAVTLVTEEPKTTWQKIKDWFYNAESVFLAWVTGVIGVATTTVSGVLASTDFSNIFTSLKSGLSFTKEQLMVMGIGAVGMGVLQYWTRVRGTKEVAGNLLPAKD
jgi:hypothetical protein